MEYEWGRYEYATFRDGELWSCSLTKDEAIEDIETSVEDGLGFESDYEYRVITEEERLRLISDLQ